MTERVTHDHPSVQTIAATIDRYGRTTRPEIQVTEPIDVAEGDVIRLVLDGSEYRTRIEMRRGRPVFRGAYETPRMAREPGSGENHLPKWVDEHDLEAGRTVHLDVVEPGFKYGLRAPGEQATYRTGRPDAGLASIAKDLEDQ